MDAIKPVLFTTPDGVERKLRATPGARKMVCDYFGETVEAVLNKYDSGAFPVILYALMHDEDGNPPAGLTIKQLEWRFPDDVDTKIETYTAILSAYSNGRIPKNEMEALVRKGAMEMGLSIGLKSSPSTPSASDSQSASSGGDTSSVNSTPESSSTLSANADGTSASA